MEIPVLLGQSCSSMGWDPQPGCSLQHPGPVADGRVCTGVLRQGLMWGLGPGQVGQPGCSSAAAGFRLGDHHCCSVSIIFIFQSHFFWHLSPLWMWLSSRRGG